jgi:hypothetical protein
MSQVRIYRLQKRHTKTENVTPKKLGHIKEAQATSHASNIIASGFTFHQVAFKT